MRNGAYTLAALATVGGLVLLMIAGQGDYRSALGTVLLAAALLLAGLGKGIDLLGHVKDGATDPDGER